MELAGHAAELGDPDEAETIYRDALQLTEALGARDQHTGEAHLRYGAFLAHAERADEARPHLEEALAVGEAADSAGLKVLALLHLAKLGDRSAEDAVATFETDGHLVGHGDRIDALHMLYQLTGDKRNLEAAYELLMFFHDHAPDENKASTLTAVRLHRDVMEARRVT